MRSYRTFSPLPPPVSRQFGGVFSVALSLRSPSLAVSQHTALGVRTFLPGLTSAAAITRPTPAEDPVYRADPGLWNQDAGVASPQVDPDGVRR